MNREKTKKLLDGFEITGCAMRNTGEAAFVAQDWTVDDPMEPHETRIFIFKPFAAPEDQWGSAGLGTFQSMHVSPSYAVGERWLFVTGTGDVFFVGDDDSDFESPIDGGKGYIWSAKSIGGPNCYFVGPNRKVIERVQKNKVVHLEAAEFAREDLVQEKGFRDIDGYSGNDLYVCGGKGDFWRYDGENWRFIDLTTNATFRRICCGTNGKVFVLVDNRFLFVGRDDIWNERKLDEVEGLIGEIRWYQDRLIILTERKCYELVEDRVVTSQLISESPLNTYSDMACNEKNIILTNRDEVAYFDGNEWSRIL